LFLQIDNTKISPFLAACLLASLLIAEEPGDVAIGKGMGMTRCVYFFDIHTYRHWHKLNYWTDWCWVLELFCVSISTFRQTYDVSVWITACGLVDKLTSDLADMQTNRLYIALYICILYLLHRQTLPLESCSGSCFWIFISDDDSYDSNNTGEDTDYWKWITKWL